MTASIKVAVVGASGRMGREVVRAATQQSNFELTAAIGRAGSDTIGLDSGVLASGQANGVAITDDLAALAGADVIIDFALPEGLAQRAETYIELAKPVVVCVTGLDEAGRDALALAATSVPIVYAANTSVGVNLLAALTEQASAVFGDQADIEVLEAHHTRKVDAPSGTALLLGEAAARGRGQILSDVAELNRNADDHVYEKGSIGFATLRAGDIVGEHTVYLVVGGERIELTHRVANRSTFADGALRAAAWLTLGKNPQIYAMKDVLGLD
ncbi:4-hydroxy-tetrahydrodipicolinate reductase [Aliidiomarina haloalkalitolerans]|uniref:4-hydroxy-tetrahydrodipicolinate reductase n=1 Tax=Aliidiomarina haloalkalitolerans TaxID=859059 RepID=A0A432VZF6_9GAMM|nr:4-hydroxy-tetrahydrodipicolinate reductase [Aliidiomarina haloalkalitolerans]RUO22028.1 4-hydroxy-tetrahydrodipicolinate reductase [Aliidiomarina haloalkalitolerans]